MRQCATLDHVGCGHPFEGVWRLPRTGARDFVAIWQNFYHKFYPFGLADRRHVGLAVGDTDVQPALVFGDAELVRLFGAHEVEHAGGARSPNQGRRTAAILDRGFGLALLGLAGVMADFDG